MKRSILPIALLLLSSSCGRGTLALESGNEAESVAVQEAAAADPEPESESQPIGELTSGDAPPVLAPPVKSDPNRTDASASQVDSGHASPDPRADAGIIELPSCAPGFSCPEEFPTCAPSRQVCVQCIGSKECPQGKYCEAPGICQDGCHSDRDCKEPTGECNRRTHECVECEVADHCFRIYGPSRSVCSQEVCRPCAEDGECPDGRLCKNGECRVPEQSE